MVGWFVRDFVGVGASFFVDFGAFGGSGGLLEPSWVPGSIFSEHGVRKTPKKSPKWNPCWNTVGCFFRCSFLVTSRLPKSFKRDPQLEDLGIHFDDFL